MTIGIVLGAALLIVILWDTFETIVLPRTVTRKLRFTVLFYRSTWTVWRLFASQVRKTERRDAVLAAFGPLSLLLLLLVWALCLILGFALIQWGLGSNLYGDHISHGFVADLYMSGTTFFTLGFGDVVPASGAGRMVAVLEAGVGFGFLAVVIGYLPVIYQSFSRREAGISLLDARAGSPPTAAEMLRRHAEFDSMAALTEQLCEWEKWASDMMESTLSYPVLVFYRSQHDRESWLAALAAILDTCALLRTGFGPPRNAMEDEVPPWQKPLFWQAQMTYAMCRHAVVDIALILKTAPLDCPNPRLDAEMLRQIRERLSTLGIVLRADASADAELADLRQQYEPYLYAIADRLHLVLPPWLPNAPISDNWQRTAWDSGNHFQNSEEFSAGVGNQA